VIDIQTQYFKLSPLVNTKEDLNAIKIAAGVLKEGGLVAFPTETVYGLGADALNPKAVKKIFEAKGRPSDNPLIVHVSSWQEVLPLVQKIPFWTENLASQLWPGPLTLVFYASPIVPPEVTAGLGTVAIRIPSHPVALKLLEYAKIPVAAPSANVSGRPSPTHAAHVLADLEGRVEVVLDGGPTSVGVESTVLDITKCPPLILRPGGVTKEKLEELLGEIDFFAKSDGVEHPRSPGMKYTHYAPRAEVYLLDSFSPKAVETMVKAVADFKARGKKVGVILTSENEKRYLWVSPPDKIFILASQKDLAGAARNIFNILRLCDAEKLDVVIAESWPEKEMGLALMNRLKKAAGERWLFLEEEKR